MIEKDTTIYRQKKNLIPHNIVGGENRAEKDWFQELRRLRDDYIDEIPPYVVHSTSKKNNYKVRRGWITQVLMVLHFVYTDKIVRDVKRRHKIKYHIEYFSSEEFRTQLLVTDEDIAKNNKIIAIMLGEEEIDESYYTELAADD